VFALVSDNDDIEEDAFQITTGFNPATAQFNVYAPQQNGLDVSGHVVWSSDILTLCSSAFIQEVDVDSDTIDDFTMFSLDFGDAYSTGDISSKANYSLTQGTGNGVFGGHGVAGGTEEEDASQWYFEATYNMNKMKLGASFGEGTDDLDDNKTDLSMLFLHYKTTDALTMMVELQAYGNDNANNDYNGLIVNCWITVYILI
jgi:hypothetical protein